MTGTSELNGELRQGGKVLRREKKTPCPKIKDLPQSKDFAPRSAGGIRGGMKEKGEESLTVLSCGLQSGERFLKESNKQRSREKRYQKKNLLCEKASRFGQDATPGKETRKTKHSNARVLGKA